MRLGTLLLLLSFALAALAPCGFARAASVDLRAAASAHSHHGARAGATHCHSEPATVLKAPCPCGCEKRAPSLRLGSLGVALIAATSELAIEPTTLPVVNAPPVAFAPPPVKARDKVPRAA